MKNIYLLFLLISFYPAVLAQDCSTPVSSSVFEPSYATVSSQANDANKLDVAISFTAFNCVSSSQVMQLASLFAAEDYRLDFCKLSYHSVTDKYNFYDVYDAFHSYSAVFKLHDFVQDQNIEYEENPSGSTPANVTFPAYNYPDWNSGSGTTKCTAPIPESDFMEMAKLMNSYPSDDAKLVAGAIFIKENCLSTAQLMKLSSLFSLEAKKFTFIKSNYQFIYDRNNCLSVIQCLNHEPYIKEWKSICNSGDYTPTTEKKCTVKEEKFKGMLKKIDDENFADDQLAVVRLINKDYCFSTAQVKRIMDAFSFPENKLDVAEILYPKCTDQENYYQLKGGFSFPSYEGQFEEIIK